MAESLLLDSQTPDTSDRPIKMQMQQKQVEWVQTLDQAQAVVQEISTVQNPTRGDIHRILIKYFADVFVYSNPSDQLALKKDIAQALLLSGATKETLIGTYRLGASENLQESA